MYICIEVVEEKCTPSTTSNEVEQPSTKSIMHVGYPTQSNTFHHIESIVSG